MLIVAPTAMLMSSLGDSVHQLVNDVQNNSLKIPARPGVEAWPVVGKQIHDVWSKAHADLPALVQNCSQIGELAKTALGFVAASGVDCCSSWRPSSLPASSWPTGSRQSRSRRSSSASSATPAAANTSLSTATIRAVALGVIGVALIQAIIVGMALLVAGFRGRVCWRGSCWSSASPRFRH